MTDENRPLEAFAEDEPLPPVYSADEEIAGRCADLEPPLLMKAN